MATPIAPTPILKGKAAKQFEEYLKRPMNEREKELKEKSKKVRDVPMFNLD